MKALKPPNVKKGPMFVALTHKISGCHVQRFNIKILKG